MDAVENPETTAEYLRLALPQMTRLGVPATPRNYAVWFTHVSGVNAELSAAIDQRVAAGGSFDDAACEELYNRHIAHEEVDLLENIRAEMATVLSEIADSVAAAGRDVHRYDGKLDALNQDVQRSTDIRDLKDLLRTLVEETRSMQAATRDLQAHFDQKSAEIAALHEELAHERRRAITDPLTGLPNRQALFDAMDVALNDTDARDTPCILMVDIDLFKRINDEFGHLIGDRVIRFVANVLTKHTKGRDTAARYGGEEFAVLLPDTGLRGAATVAQTLRKTVADARLVRADTKTPLGQVTISVGIAHYRRGEDVMTFLNRADRAMYAAKRAGRNRVIAETELPAPNGS